MGDSALPAIPALLSVWSPSLFFGGGGASAVSASCPAMPIPAAASDAPVVPAAKADPRPSVARPPAPTKPVAAIRPMAATVVKMFLVVPPLPPPIGTAFNSMSTGRSSVPALGRTRPHISRGTISPLMTATP